MATLRYPLGFTLFTIKNMNNTLFKDLSVGSPIYALVKGDDELHYEEGSIVSIGQQRLDVPQVQPNTGAFVPQMPATKNVVDVTYTLMGKNYTDAVEVTSYMFPTEKTGAITLIATDKEPIIRELKATQKRAEDFLKKVETEIPRNKKRVEECKAYISLLDTEYAEKQEMETRIKRLEEGTAETNNLLKSLIAKFDKIK